MLNLRNKILIVAITIVVVCQFSTMGMVMYTAKHTITKQAKESLKKDATLMTGLTTSQVAQATSIISALTRDTKFVDAVNARNIYAIDAVISNPKNLAGAAVAFVVNDKQEVLTQFGGSALLNNEVGKLLSRQASQPNVPLMMSVNDSAYYVIIAPIESANAATWLALGYAMDQTYVDQIEKFVGLQTSLFLVENTTEPKLLASSLPAPEHAALIKEVKTATNFKTLLDPGVINVGKTKHLAILKPFVRNQEYLQVLVSKPLDQAVATYTLIHNTGAVLTIIPLLIALIAAILLSRAVTRPIKQLMKAAERIQVGVYDQTVRIDTADELNEFAQAFNAMQSEISAREECTAYQAKHDGLTGLYNRDFAMDCLTDSISIAQEYDEKLAVMIISLNARQEISSTLGHEIADAYLAKAAHQIRSIINEEYIVARLEIDTFMVMLNHTNVEGAKDIAQDFVARIALGIKLDDVNVSVLPRIGIAVYPDHGDTRERLMLRATIAKTEGTKNKRPVSVYHEGDEEQRVRNMALLHDLKTAIQEGALIMHYQPKINVADETVCGVEALIRWDHPTYGWLPPNEFIPIIEQSGNISILTRWVLETVAKQHKQWREQGLDLSIAVNLSAHDLEDHELPWFIMDILRSQKLPPEKLIVEITEQAMVRDFGNAITVLNRLRDLGIRVSIDDFGTGYSSFSQLKKLPVNELKIDRSFVAKLPGDPADEAIVSTAIDLAHKLKLDIVAEGVASGASYRWLRAHGIDSAQGFYWSKPIPADELSNWISDFTGGSTQYVRALDINSSKKQTVPG
jgi:diguanylate cyclase (GGDEF)-like protein